LRVLILPAHRGPAAFLLRHLTFSLPRIWPAAPVSHSAANTANCAAAAVGQSTHSAAPARTHDPQAGTRYVCDALQ
jgi:hypothetical protein